jgi:hypothetical protein
MYQPRLAFDYSNNLKDATEIVLPKQRSKAIIGVDYTDPLHAVQQLDTFRVYFNMLPAGGNLK